MSTAKAPAAPSDRICEKYNYIVYFNTQPTFLKLTKLVAMATFILFQTCLKIEFW